MSVYKYFRPLMVYCYMVGQFSANKVLSETADELEFKYMKVPLIMCAVNVTFSFCTVVHVFLGDTFNKTPITFHHLALTTLYVLIMVWSLLFGSKCLIRGFKSVDRLRKTSSSDLRFQLNIPAQFLLLTCLLLCLYHLLVIFVVTRFNVPLYKKMIFIIFYLLHPSSAYRQALTLSCLYGICGHVVQETVVCWRRYCLRNDRSFRYVGNFCRLVLAQTEILTSLNGILENYLVVFLIARYIFTCISMLFYIKFSETATVNSIDLLTWSIMITVLALCVDSTAIQVADIGYFMSYRVKYINSSSRFN
ncbi:hypothetical protein J6590_063166 [Homalodisca vitripennis]|nr:hypothetical protein J6590_063166 [Homalodisca vitripennis]